MYTCNFILPFDQKLVKLADLFIVSLSPYRDISATSKSFDLTREIAGDQHGTLECSSRSEWVAVRERGGKMRRSIKDDMRNRALPQPLHITSSAPNADPRLVMTVAVGKRPHSKVRYSDLRRKPPGYQAERRYVADEMNEFGGKKMDIQMISYLE
jgi:hypothetical protein